MKHRWMVPMFALLAGLLLVAGCNFPMLNPAEPDPGMIYTAAAETALANATLLAQPRPTITFLFTPQPSGTAALPTQAAVTLTTQPVGSVTPGNTTQPATCDRARFVRDVTVPDGTDFAPGEKFTKTWRLLNTGTCPWTANYALIFVDGDRLGAPDVLKFTDRDVPPGAEVDVSVELTAPGDTGEFQADFQLQNASGQKFGVGDEGDKTFWVRIDVVVPGGLAFDLLARASAADWATGAGSADTELAFNGDPDAAAGFAGIVENVLMEDGRTSAKILVTYPAQVNNGIIEGVYSPYTVQAGDRLLGRVGFLVDSGGDCGPGEVVFRIQYQEGTNIRQLSEFRKRCDGKLLPIDLDLAALRGKTVSFIIQVDASGPAAGDRAFWTSLRVER
jgi:hypothetical protein